MEYAFIVAGIYLVFTAFVITPHGRLAALLTNVPIIGIGIFLMAIGFQALNLSLAGTL